MPRVAVITGASSGIGRALARELAREGYAVGLTARRADRLEALAEEIRAAGGTAAVAPADVADREGHIGAVHALAAALGPIDLFVANAGVGLSQAVDVPNAPDYETMVRVNLLGPYYGFEAVLPSMRERGAGHLVAVSSLGAYIAGPGSGQYCATKAGLSRWMEAVRLELTGSGIAVTTIHPGFVATPMTEKNDFDMLLIMRPERAARLMARAIRKRKAVYDFPWRMRQAIRLVRLLPKAVQRRLLRRGAAE